METSMFIKPQLTHAAGIDIHKGSFKVCFYILGELEELKEYETYTCDLFTLRDDLLKLGIKDVLMESTGVYWIALCSVLMESGIRVCVANAMFIKNMPKEKTDRKDARWLCKLLVNGQVRNSFVVGEAQRAFRDLCRMRTQYTGHITQAQNRIVKNLERRNIKLRSVVSSMDTKSAMSIVAALAAGETDMERLLSLCRGKLRKKKELMRKALQGVMQGHDRMVLQLLLDDIAHYKSVIAKVNFQIKQHTDKMNSQLISHLLEIKGVGPMSTEIILAEIGDNVNPFATADKLSRWVGLAPGNNESGGKSKFTATRKGNVYMRTAMIQIAWAAVRTRDTYWRAQYYHLTRRMHAKKAIVVIARKLLQVIYKIIKGTLEYKEYGGQFFADRLAARKAS